VLNELLTGQASLEPPREASPYREPSVPQQTQRCLGCKESFSTPVTADVARYCPTCTVAGLEAQTASTRATVRALEEQERKARARFRILKWGALIALGVAVVVVRVAIRKEERESAAQAAGYSSYAEYERDRDVLYPTDEFSDKVHDLTRQMCSCEDLKCARDVRAVLDEHVSRNSPTDTMAARSAAADMDELFACQAKLEAR
jgi:hypothetical protein